MKRLLAKHVFFVVGVAAIAYFFVIDLETRRLGFIDYAMFAVGFVAMAIYVVQSFMRFGRER